MVLGTSAKILRSGSLPLPPQEGDNLLFPPLEGAGGGKAPDTTKKSEPVQLPFPFTDKSREDPLYNTPGSGLILANPSNIKTNVNYDPPTGLYNVTQTIGNQNYRPPSFMDFDEYLDYNLNKSIKGYWKQRTHAESKNQNHALRNW